MATITFIPDSLHQQADWDDPARWTGGVVPNNLTVDVIVPTTTFVATGDPYFSTINEFGFHAAGSLTISDNSLIIQGNLAVSHNVDLAATASIQTNGSLTAASIDNNGYGGIYGSGHVTVTGQFLNETQVGGSLLLTAGSLTNTGTLTTAGENTVVVNHGGFTNLSGSTLSGGSYQAGVDLANSPRNFNLYLNVGGVIATDAANILLGTAGHIYSFDDVSHTYVSIQSSVHSIAASGKLSLTASTFAWSDLTVDGQVTLTRSTLNASHLTVDAGGMVRGAGAIGGPILNNGKIIVTPLDNLPTALGNGMTINGPVSGSGTVEIGPAIPIVINGHQIFATTKVEIGAAFSNTVVFDDGHAVVTLDDAADFSGSIKPAATGDQIILNGISFGSLISYSYSGDSHGGTLAVKTTGGEYDLHFLGSFITADFSLTPTPQRLSSDPQYILITNTGAGTVVFTPIAEDSGARLITQAELLAGGAGTATGLAIISGIGTLVDNHNGTWSYTPALNDDSGVTFAYTTTSGSGSEPRIATLDITPVNDAPVNTVPGPLSTTSNVDFAITGLSVSDVDAITLTTILHVDHGTLTVGAAGGAAIGGNGTANVILSGHVAEVTAALSSANNVLYHSASGFSGTDHLTMTSKDGGGSGVGGELIDTDVVNIQVGTPAPVVLAPIAEDSGARSITQAELLSGTAGVAASLAISSGNGTLVDNHNGTWSYTPAHDDDSAVAFSYQITSGGGSVTNSATLDITPVNDAPVNTVPGAQSTSTDTDFAISGLAVSDVDATSLTTTLHVDHGALAVGAVGGAAVSGNGTATVTVTGSVAQIDAALGAAHNVLYHSAFNFSGIDHLTMTSNDGGSSGAGGALTDTDIVNIQVAAASMQDIATPPHLAFGGLGASSGGVADFAFLAADIGLDVNSPGFVPSSDFHLF
jgi:hypothetical protein